MTEDHGAADGRSPDATELADHWWWRPGWGPGTRYYTWHLTLDDQPELRALLAATQLPLRGLPILDVVPEQWLHLTTQGVGHVSDVSDDDRDAVVAAVRRRLAVLVPGAVTFHRAVLYREGVVLAPTDPAPLIAVRDSIRAGIADVWGPDRVPDLAHGFHPHITAAYVNAPATPALVRAALDHARTAPVIMTPRTASLIVQNRDHRMYQWTLVATASIGSSPLPTHS